MQRMYNFYPLHQIFVKSHKLIFNPYTFNPIPTSRYVKKHAIRKIQIGYSVTVRAATTSKDARGQLDQSSTSPLYIVLQPRSLSSKYLPNP